MQHTFVGSMVDGEGNTIYRKVSGWYFTTEGSQFGTWGGILTIESGEPPSLFDGKLVIDGRQGDVVATSMTDDSNTIEFTGSGPAPCLNVLPSA